MGNVNFYLKKADSSGRSLIFLRYFYNGKKIDFAFGQTIEPKNWNSEKQRVKNNRFTTTDGKHSLNDLLDNLVRVCNTAYNTEIKNGIPEPETLKRHLTAFINQNQEQETGEKEDEQSGLMALIDRFIDGEIKHKGKRKTEGTIKTYKTSKNSLLGFEKHMQQLAVNQGGNKHYQLDFDKITLDFFYKYIDFLSNQYKEVDGKKIAKIVSQNTLGRYIKTIKVFMGEAVDLGLTDNLQYKHRKFAVDWVETDAVYLTEDELNQLYKYDFSDKKRLEQVRDLFVFGAWVGLRFSDYSNIQPENIVLIEGEYFVKIITQKTKELVVVPFNPVVLQIFNKYKNNRNNLPETISNQKFNDYIKEVCKEAGLNELGRLSTEPKLQLWECISSHTARRSFATNYYLQGFPTIDLMKITGHTTEKVFLNYIKVTKLDTAKRLSKHIKMWTEKTNKAAETLLKAV
ncbi:MAG: Integrase family protein [Segetibacter sp.]|nr:Integrase family protein [Segetibacter sp.]